MAIFEDLLYAIFLKVWNTRKRIFYMVDLFLLKARSNSFVNTDHWVYHIKGISHSHFNPSLVWPLSHFVHLSFDPIGDKYFHIIFRLQDELQRELDLVGRIESKIKLPQDSSQDHFLLIHGEILANAIPIQMKEMEINHQSQISQLKGILWDCQWSPSSIDIFPRRCWFFTEMHL